MANEKKIRLIAMARKLNVGASTLTDLLTKQNCPVEGGNPQLDDKMISVIEKEFGKDKKVEKVNIKERIITNNETVSLDDVNKNKSVNTEEKAEDNSLLVKSNIIDRSDLTKRPQPVILGKIDLDALKKPSKREKAPKEVIKETPKEIVKVTPKVVVKETPKVVVKETPKEVVKETPKKIVQKAPTEPVKEAPKEEKTTQPSAIEPKQDKVIEKQTKAAPTSENIGGTENKVETQAKSTQLDATVKTNVDLNKTFDDREAEKSGDLFRLNSSDSLSGPKIIGKIDLNVFEKKKTDNSDKKKGKRKRIKKDGKVDITDPKNSTPQNRGAAAGGNRPAGGPGGNRPGGGPGGNRPGGGPGGNRPGGGPGGNRPGGGPGGNRPGGGPGGNRPGGGPGQGAKKGKNQRSLAPKAEIKDEDVQKQIKDTLARLTSKGNKTKSSKYRRDKRDAVSARISEETERQESEKSTLKLTEFVTVSDLAGMMDASITDVITACMNLGLMVSINQRLDAEALVVVAEEFGFSVEFVSIEIQEQIAEEEDREEDRLPRSPIITVMGHVDHGKTSLLDFIRKANVIAGEAGGITQHIGAYSVQVTEDKRITFLDTPGHEAFTAMRARGAQVTDVAIIIIAADDSVMPQTIEAINHATAAGVPIIFALNKIDKPGANTDKIREELAQMNYLVEDWGGKYQCQEIAARSGQNVEELLEKIILEADLLELKANPNKRASGVVIESTLDKGRGYVSTVLVEQGTLRVGDVLLSGTYSGRVKAMFNERGNRVTEALPATPVLVLGLNGAPQAGDTFNVMEDDKRAREVANKREQLQRIQGLKTQKHITLDEIGRRIAIGNFQELNIIVKGDVDGSVEALTDSLIKQSKDEVQVNVIHKAVGQISESDVLLAAASNAVIIGFQVRPSSSARKLAEKEEIEIRQYSIIYDAINDIKDAIVGMLAPEIKEEITCSVEIMEVFKITKVGNIAGCLVREGKITRGSKIRIIREGIVVYSGKLGSLKRFKDDVKEVGNNLECGLNIDGYNDIKAGDIVEGYEEVEIRRS